MNERIMDLIEGAAAESLSPTEIAELDALSQADPAIAAEIKSAFEDILFSSAVVAAQTEAAVPDGFSDRIMSALPERAAWEGAPARPKKLVFRTRGTSLRGFIFGAGAWAIAAVFVLFMFTSGDIEVDSSTSGSMMEVPAPTTSLGSEDVTVDIIRSDDGTNLYIANRRTDNIEIIVSGAELGADAPTNAVSIEGGISIRQSQVTESIIPVTIPDASDIAIQIIADGTVVFSHPAQ